MSEKNNEVISSLMDGEWGDLDASASLADVCASKEQQEVWARYHLARDAMRGESVEGSFSIASAVSAAIADEPVYTNVTAIGARAEDSFMTGGTAAAESSAETVPNSDQNFDRRQTKPGGFRWGLGAAGLGIAASAALATFIGLNHLGLAKPSNATGGLVAGTQTLVAPGAPSGQAGFDFSDRQAPVDLVSNRGSFWVGESGQRVEAESRLNMLLSDHIENSPVSDWSGMLPYSRLVGYDESVPAE